MTATTMTTTMMKRWPHQLLPVALTACLLVLATLQVKSALGWEPLMDTDDAERDSERDKRAHHKEEDHSVAWEQGDKEESAAENEYATPPAA